MMQIYLVGGAVRDHLLQLPVKERDWVVTGATPDDMLALGYRPVGKDFPVFLHPKTHEEYALARTERKIAAGYKGFNFYTSPEVTLIEDLSRRDLTINAMAQTVEGHIIDPYQGQRDLKAHVFRHVSLAFQEDPVRILRLARFAAYLPHFTVHWHTLQLMKKMVQQNEVNALVPERVWQEWARALEEKASERFFTVLFSCGALAILLPELVENEVGFAALKRASIRQLVGVIRFATIFYSLTVHVTAAVIKRYKIPKYYADLALLVCTGYLQYVKVYELDSQAQLCLLESLDAFRRPERFELFLLACEAIADELPKSNKSIYWRAIYYAAKSVSIVEMLSIGLEGITIKNLLKQKRLQTIKQLKQ